MKTLKTRIENGCFWITLNRPEARNALSRQMVAELEQAIEQAESDGAVQTVVLVGAGGHFCAGADLADMAAARVEAGDDPEAMAAINRRFGRLIESLDASSRTVVAGVDGSAFGGGVGLACVADVCLMTRQARLGLPEVTLGLPPAQIIPFVVGRVGLSEARRLALTGTRIHGDEAFRIGLAHVLADNSEALELMLTQTVDQIRRCAPDASRQTKALLRATVDSPTAELLDRGARIFAEAAMGAEAIEGTRAFMEKRRPDWLEARRKPES
ncbi:MAG: enoyl-CoA hydratase/isomerase family protein [Pseudomonadota bacterium]|nr:MAG: enoyl-CoA hydratase/isomerase family protein [Pseudomonadota bacterium]